MSIPGMLRKFAAAAAVAAIVAAGGCAEQSNRDDFSSLLKNKTEAEVLKFAGKPAQVDSSQPDRLAWVYKSRTFDVATRKSDPQTTVIFKRAEDGKLHVAEVVFD